MATPDFEIKLSEFQQGLSYLYHLDEYTFIGDKGQASEMKNVDTISKPGVLKQGPGLSTLTNGNDSGVVDELIEFIMDRSVNGGETYGMGESKLFKINPGEVVDNSDFPRSISDCEEGESVIEMNGNLFYFYNKSSEGDIGVYDSFSSFDDDWGSTTDKALEKAPHPAATKEDILVFGNGRYLGVYIEGLGTLDTQKLDFGPSAEVADVVFSSNSWYIAVNRGESGDNRNLSQVYMYDGSAISNLLTDEAGLGYEKIGFLYVRNGVVWTAFNDLSSDGYAVGYVSGRKIEPVRFFKGDLPTYKDKSLYKNTIIFNSDGSIYSAAAPVPELSSQLSNHASGKYDELGGIAVPFGTPLIASTDGSNYDISEFSDYTTDAEWKSISSMVTNYHKRGQPDKIIVYTEPLHKDASCEVRIVGDCGEKKSSWEEVSGENKIRHEISVSMEENHLSDLRVEVRWNNGDTSEDCPVRNITVLGHYVS